MKKISRKSFLKGAVGALGIATVGILTGCGSNAVSIDPENLEQTKKLRVYVNSNYQPNPVEYATDYYQAAHPEVQTEYYSLSGDESSLSEDERMQALSSALQSGSGPDIIIDHCSSSAFRKMATSGAFLDLQPLFDANPEFMEGLDADLLAAGALQNKQVVIPLYYANWSLGSTEETLLKYGFAEENYSAEDFLQKAQEFLEQNPAMALCRTSDSTFESFLGMIFPCLSAQQDAQQTLESELFRSYVDLLKESISRESLPAFTATSSSYVEQLESEQYLFALCHGNSSLSQLATLSQIGTPTFLTVENMQGGLTGSIALYCAISAKSANLQNAWDYLCYVTTTMQNPMEFDEAATELPSMLQWGRNLRLSADEEWVGQIQAGKVPEIKLRSVSGVINSYQIVPLPQSVADRYLALPQRISVREYSADGTDVFAYFDAYLDGSSSYDECLKQAINYLKLYQSE